MQNSNTILPPQLINNETYLDPKIWGKYIWFTLHTFALQYPNKPNAVIKKKYFRFFTDLQDFLPNSEVKKTYADFLNNFPISPYLDSRLSLLKWVNFIHNKYNALFEKDQVELYKGLEMYYENYKTDEYNKFKIKKMREKYLIAGACVLLLIGGYYLSRN